MSAEEVANAFVSHYYNTFDSNPDQLMGLFVRGPISTMNPYLRIAQNVSQIIFLFFCFFENTAHLSLSVFFFHSIIAYILT
jgi:hypothetical protein